MVTRTLMTMLAAGNTWPIPEGRQSQSLLTRIEGQAQGPYSVRYRRPLFSCILILSASNQAAVADSAILEICGRERFDLSRTRVDMTVALARAWHIRQVPAGNVRKGKGLENDCRAAGKLHLDKVVQRGRKYKRRRHLSM